MKGFISHRIQVGNRRLFVSQDLNESLWYAILQSPDGSELLLKTKDKVEAESTFIEALNDISGGDSNEV